MSRLLPRFTETQLDHHRQIAAAVAASEQTVVPSTTSSATLSGDTRRLRGIPTVARGVSGTSPGTDPLIELLRSDR